MSDSFMSLVKEGEVMVVHDNLSAVLMCSSSDIIFLTSLGVMDRHKTQKTFQVSIVCSLVEIIFHFYLIT